MMNIYQELNMANRDEAVIFLKSLICEKPQPCPICGGKLDFLHKKRNINLPSWDYSMYIPKSWCVD